MTASNTSRIVNFTLGEGTDHRGRLIQDIWSQDDFWLEHTHDYIQWLFPIPEAGRFNGFAPLLDVETRKWFANSPELQAQQARSLDRMLRFFGLRWLGDRIEADTHLNLRDHIWLKAGGHNHLRITRIIRSLHLCGQAELARAFQAAVIQIGTGQGYVTEATVGFWMRATEDPGSERPGA